MNNDIKEILEDIKDKTRDYVGVNGCLYQDLDREELDLLLEYITNLQEEKDKYKRYVDDDFLYTYEELQDKVIEKQQRIYKAIEYIESYHNTALWKCDKENLLNILRGEDDETN